MRGRLKTILVYFGILEDRSAEARRDARPDGARDTLFGALGLAIVLVALAGVGALNGHPVDGDEVTTILALVGGVLLVGLARLAWNRLRAGRRQGG